MTLNETKVKNYKYKKKVKESNKKKGMEKVQAIKIQ